MNEPEQFCWGECPTLGAAISRFAERLRPHFFELCKSDREALARVAILTDAGRVQGESSTLVWSHAEGPAGRRGDVLYTVE